MEVHEELHEGPERTEAIEFFKVTKIRFISETDRDYGRIVVDPVPVTLTIREPLG